MELISLSFLRLSYSISFLFYSSWKCGIKIQKSIETVRCTSGIREQMISIHLLIMRDEIFATRLSGIPTEKKPYRDQLKQTNKRKKKNTKDERMQLNGNRKKATTTSNSSNRKAHKVKTAIVHRNCISIIIRFVSSAHGALNISFVTFILYFLFFLSSWWFLCSWLLPQRCFLTFSYCCFFLYSQCHWNTHIKYDFVMLWTILFSICFVVYHAVRARVRVCVLFIMMVNTINTRNPLSKKIHR